MDILDNTKFKSDYLDYRSFVGWNKIVSPLIELAMGIWFNAPMPSNLKPLWIIMGLLLSFIVQLPHLPRE